MPKVVPKPKPSPPEDAAATTADDAVVADIEVPPLPPILPNNNEIATADGEGGASEGAAKDAAADKPAAHKGDDGNNNYSEQPTFYAVRVGYAACPSCSSSKMDDATAAAAAAVPSSDNSNCSHVSTIRSAIFLRWEDVQQFVEFQNTTPPPAAAAAAAGATASATVNVPFHHNVDYKEFNDMARALEYLQQGMITPSSSSNNKQWFDVRSLPRNNNNNLAVKTFNPPTKKWEAMYQAALDFKATYGHSDILSAVALTEDEKELVKWVKYQRTSYKAYLEDPMGRNHAMTSTKVYRLKEAGFDWIDDDREKWLNEGTKKRGRPRKTEVSPDYRKKQKRNEVEERKNRPIRQKWLDMFDSLKQYKSTHGTVIIPEDDNSDEHKELKQWVKAQQSNYVRWREGADVGMTQEKANLLTDLGMEFAPSWDEMFARVVAYKSQHGHINITSEEDAPLTSWMAKQNHVLGRHLNGMTTRLKKEQVSRLMNVGFEGGRKKFVSGDASFTSPLWSSVGNVHTIDI